MRILLTADPMIEVPPIGYGGIERIVDALVREYGKRGHEVGLVAREGSTSPATHLYPWPSENPRGVVNTLRNTNALRTGGLQVSIGAKLAGKTLLFTACSEFICRQGRPSGGTWQAIHNFVEPDKFTFVPEVADDAPLVFLSRLDRIKGADTAISIARCAGRRLILAGNHAQSGHEFDYWKREIEPHLGRDGIEWVGEVDDKAKNELLGKAAALLVPIRWDEPFGIVFAEALACGTPVISSPHGALTEIVDEGRTGFLIKNEEEGVEAVRRIASLSRAACRQAAEERFSVGFCAQKYLDAYSATIEACRRT